MIWLISCNIILLLIAAFFFLKTRKLVFSLQAEKIKTELAARKEFFEVLLNSTPDPIFVKNKKHQWIYGNEAFTKIIGMGVNEYVGKSDYDVFPKEMADVFWKKDNETLDHLKVTENEEFIMVEGKIRTILTKKTPVRLNEQTILVGVIRDITERKQYEEQIRNLYGLIESSSDLYCLSDLSGKPEFINHHGQALGYSTSLSHYKNFFSNQFKINEVEDSLKQNNSWEGEAELINLVSNELVPYWIKVFYILDEKGEPKTISLVATNIRDRKESELRLLLASKMASLGEMAGSIAHEINNPLAIISGKAEQIKKNIKQGTLDVNKILASVEKIEDTSFRISKIIRGLRTFSRSEELDPMKEVSVLEVIDETLDLCRERLKSENIKLVTDIDPTIILQCRPTQIQQVIINLLNNSLDAIKDDVEKWISIETAKTSDSLSITITDSGKGIPPQLRDRIMTPFFTTKEIGKGTGLGLSISKGIMESHQGTLRYNENSPNTSFSLVFNT
jgi:PAS domain S-box-containing protein